MTHVGPFMRGLSSGRVRPHKRGAAPKTPRAAARLSKAAGARRARGIQSWGWQFRGGFLFSLFFLFFFSFKWQCQFSDFLKVGRLPVGAGIRSYFGKAHGGIPLDTGVKDINKDR